MAKYGVIESTNMLSTRGAKRIFDCVASEDIENGLVGYIEELADGESVIYNFHKGLKDGAAIVIVDQPAWSTDTSLRSNQAKDKYIVPAGTPFRVRELGKNDEFGINNMCVNEATRDELAEGVYLTVDGNGKFVASATKTEDAKFEAEVMRKRIQGASLVTESNIYGRSTDIYEVKVTTLA